MEQIERIGAYRIVRPLGWGGMGAVYEVEHEKLGVHYALKTFMLDHGHVDLLKERFLAEGRVLRGGVYRADAGKFRYYLATMIRRELVSHWRKAQVRGATNNIPLSFLKEEPSVEPEVAAVIDAKWRIARHEATVEHALTKTALSARTREIYRAYVLEERSIGEVAARFGVTKNYLGLVKLRVGRMIAALEAEYGD